jgi:phosphoribosylformylglycinamidine synthase
VSDGGIAVAVAEMALAGDIGARLQMAPFETQADRERIHHAWSLFSETQGRYIVTAAFDDDSVEKLASDLGIGCCVIGWTVGTAITFERGSQTVYPAVALDTLRAAHEGFFPALMNG